MSHSRPSNLGPRKILIKGPTEVGTFFLRDLNGSVWSFGKWRGFGPPTDFTFREAWREASRQTSDQLS